MKSANQKPLTAEGAEKDRRVRGGVANESLPLGFLENFGIDSCFANL